MPLMLGLDLVRPLEPDWRGSVDDVARAQRWPTTHDVARLAASVRALSAAYNDPSQARASAETDGAARLGFFFARDVPKGAAAVRELVATGALRLDEVLRVLDLGAGMGASTWGIARALEAAGKRGTVHATWVDTDRRALDVGMALASRREGRSPIALRVDAQQGSLTQLGPLGTFDVVMASGLLSELDVGMDGPTRVQRHAALVSNLLEHGTQPHGAVVLVEPALRDRTRHLHAVRDALLALGELEGGREAPPASMGELERGREAPPSSMARTVFAPCLHTGTCPALVRESDWCHEDLRIDLPTWLVPVARAAGLRHEGLTFAYLILRRDGIRLVDALASAGPCTRARVVSESMRTKGKREAFLCGEFPSGSNDPSARSAARVRATRLDRDRTELNAAWEHVDRGDLLVIDPAIEPSRARVGRNADVKSIDRCPGR